MAPFVQFLPGTPLIDPSTGKATMAGFQIFQALLALYQGTISEGVTTDGIQTLTNKTIDGDANTLEDIATASLKSKTGTASRVVTGFTGTGGDLAQWDSSGNIQDGPNLGNTLASYVPIAYTANGAVATALSSIGPTGANTTVQEWLTVIGSDGVTLRYIPGF